MIKLDQEIATHIDQAFMPEGNVCWIAIAREPGEQDLGPKGSTMVFDDQCLVYRERVRRPTLVHLEENPNGVLVYRNAEERLQAAFLWRNHRLSRRPYPRPGDGQDHTPGVGA